MDGEAYGRVLVLDALAKSPSAFKSESVDIISHQHGKGEAGDLYTDHYPIVVKFNCF